MVVINLHLIALKPGYTVQSFLRELHRNGIKPIVQAVVLRWMIMPSHLSAGHLLGRNIRWDMLLVLDAEVTTSSPARIPPDARAQILAEWSASCGVSSRALLWYSTDNAELLHPGPQSVAPPAPPEVAPSSSSSQNLEMSAELKEWIASSLPARLRDRPVSMLNLLSFHEGKEDQYKRYGAEFKAKVGARHGAKVKLVGKVVGEQARDDGWDEGWDEVAFVHYPSVRHFAAMAASADYQDVNRKYRLGALRDTFILCVMEVDDRGEIVADQAIREKL